MKTEGFALLGLILGMLALPLLPLIAIWYVFAPTAIWPQIVLVIISIILYVVFLIIEFIVLMVVCD